MRNAALKKGDYVIIALVALLSLALFAASLQRSENCTAHINVDGQAYKTIALSDNMQPVEIEITTSHTVKITAQNGRIRFSGANCPDKTCVKTGWIHSPWQSAACVPSGIIIKISGQAGDIDAIVK